MSTIKKTILSLGIILSAFAAAGVSSATACDTYSAYRVPVHTAIYTRPVVQTYVPVRPVYVPVQHTYRVNYYNHGGHCW